MNAIEPGTLVTSAKAPDGKPDWCGVVASCGESKRGPTVDIWFFPQKGMMRHSRLQRNVRKLSYDEALALAPLARSQEDSRALVAYTCGWRG